MRRVALLLAFAGCAHKAPPRDPYVRAFEACYAPVRAHACATGTSAEQDACMDRFGLRYDGAGSGGARRALLLDGGCPPEVVGSELAH